MEKRFYHSIFKALLIFSPISACIPFVNSDDNAGEPIDHVLHGSITYPFVRTNPLGVNGKPEKFVIKSISGGTEYVIEIPDAGENYDIEIPLAVLQQGKSHENLKNIGSAAQTDREIMGSLPDMSKEAQAKTDFLDKAFGVGKNTGPQQSPSYTLGLAKISRLFRDHKYEYALIEANNLLSYYPQSPRLHKMKGTIYVKLQNYPLAEKSWIRALGYNPRDKVLRKSISKLQKRIQHNYLSPKDSDLSLPSPVSRSANAPNNEVDTKLGTDEETSEAIDNHAEEGINQAAP